MTRKTTIHLTLTLVRIEETRPSSGPFKAARRVIDTTGEAVDELSSRPGLRKAATANVIAFPIKRVASGG